MWNDEIEMANGAQLRDRLAVDGFVIQSFVIHWTFSASSFFIPRLVP